MRLLNYWVAIGLLLECDREYIIGSAFRFMAEWPDEEVSAFVGKARGELDEPIPVLALQKVALLNRAVRRQPLMRPQLTEAAPVGCEYRTAARRRPLGLSTARLSPRPIRQRAAVVVTATNRPSIGVSTKLRSCSYVYGMSVLLPGLLVNLGAFHTL